MKKETQPRQWPAKCVYPWILVSFGLCMQAVAQEVSDRDERMRQLEAPFCTLAYAKSLVKDQPDERFVRIAVDDVPKRLQQATANFLALLMRSAAQPSPIRGPSRLKSVRVYAAYRRGQDDLIEYAWDHNGRSVRVISGLNAIRIDLRLAEFGDCSEATGTSCVIAIRSFVSEIVTTEGEDTRQVAFRVDIPWRDDLNDGAWMSTAPEASLRLLWSWHERVDVVVENGVLSILFYKKIPQLMAYQDGSKWFHDEFRALVHKKAREQGITAPATQGE